MTNFSTPFSRRHFLQKSLIGAGLTATGLVFPRRSDALEHCFASRNGEFPLDDVPITDDPRVKQLLQKGVDAAVAAGASYADMRLTHTRTRNLNLDRIISEGREKNRKLKFISVTIPQDFEEITVGVRALVKGYWGFASGPVWSVAEAERLGGEAARQAMANAVSFGKTKDTALAPTDRVTGAWTSPVAIDPFSVHPQQLKDILRGIIVFAVHRSGVTSASINTGFQRQDKAFCSSIGSYFTQRYHQILPAFIIEYQDMVWGLDQEGFTDSSKGFEIFDEQRMRDSVEQIVAEIEFDRSLPTVPLDVGRYETVFTPAGVASLLNATIGAATELDRALGFESNADGTSYLNDPVAMLGNEKIGSTLINVTADRSQPHGLATVKWDDEGVIPETIPLVTNGVLTGYQTNREGAAWLAAAKPNVAARSSGGAFAPTGVDSPLVHTANLYMHSDREAQNLESLIGDVKKGLLCHGGGVLMDFQLMNGFGNGAKIYEIENGKIVARGVGLQMMFRSSEIWKGIRAIGDTSSRRTYGVGGSKGEPRQSGRHTISAVPMLHESLSFIDMGRKA